MLRDMVFLLFLLFGLGTLMAQGHVSQANYTPQEANAIISNSSQYVASINESGYLIFQPNLTKAYRDLNLANGNVTTNPDLAVRYANNAYGIARDQYNSVRTAETASLPYVAAFTVVMLVLLYIFMRPVKKRQR